ncbi:hypothetical protein Gotur_026777, partial [Gossypium turneri]
MDFSVTQLQPPRNQEGLIEDERYRALSKIADHPTQTLIFFSLPFLCDWNGSEDFLLTI